MVPNMYSGSWRVDEPHEVFLDGYWQGALDLQQHPWSVSFYVQNLGYEAGRVQSSRPDRVHLAQNLTESLRPDTHSFPSKRTNRPTEQLTRGRQTFQN